jgi:hypothetical protein
MSWFSKRVVAPEAPDPWVEVVVDIKPDATIPELVDLLQLFANGLGQIHVLRDDRDVLDADGKPRSRHIKRYGEDSPWRRD